MIKLNITHYKNTSYIQNVLQKRVFSGLSNKEAITNKKKFINIMKRDFISLNLNFVKNFFKLRKHRGELIIHPEFESLSKENSKISEKMREKFKINEEEDVDEESTADEDLNFIKLDKNGVPIIKKNFYESLGVSQTASPREIKKNFLKIAKKYHPDKHPESLVITHINS